MSRGLLALLLMACFQRNDTIVGENDGAGGGEQASAGAGGSAGGSTAGGSSAGGSGGSAGGTAAGPDIDVQPVSLDFGRVARPVTRLLTVRNVGTGELRITRWSVRPKNAASTPGAVCVGRHDGTTSTCLHVLPPGSEPVMELRLPIRIQPQGPNAQLEWDVDLFSNDADEPLVTVNVRAQSVTLPPCQFTVTPPALNFGLLQDPAGRELSFVFRNLGANAGEDCLISWLDLSPGSASVFTLPGGPVWNVIVPPAQSLRVPVRAQPPSGPGAALQTQVGQVSLYVSSPAGVVDVALSAQTGNGCLWVSPASLDFGDVTQGCGSELQTLTVSNLCSQQVTFQPPAFAPASSELAAEGAPIVALAPSASDVVRLRYRPMDLGLDTAVLRLRAVESGQTVDYVVPVRGTGSPSAPFTDQWRQESRVKADLLFVISNAPSMADDQQVITELGLNGDSFLQYATGSGADYRIGVITTDLLAPDAGQLIGGAISSLNPMPAFAQRLQVGTGGSSTPAVAELVLRASSPNAGFLRPDARLSIIAITDARDHSPMSPAYYEARLRALKPLSQLSFNVIGPVWPASGGCPVDDPWPASSTLRALTLAFGGSHASICAPSMNWGNMLEQIARDAFGYRASFRLARQPDLGAGSLTVSFDSGSGPMAVPAMTMQGMPVWRFDAPTNAVVFEPLFVPAPGDLLQVRYSPVCH